MSHEISNIDKQEGTFMGWHGLTDVKAVILLATCCLAMWDVMKRALFRPFTKGETPEALRARAQEITNEAREASQEENDDAKWTAYEDRIWADLCAQQEKDLARGYQETDSCEVVCTDDESIRIGKTVNCKSYTLLPNKRFLSIVQSALDSIRGATVASVGSVCRRARIFVSLALPAMESTLADVGETFSLNAAGRTFKFYLSFFSSHDKSAPFGVQLSTVCVVCNNTFNAVLHDDNGKALKIRIPHTKNMEAKLADVPAIVDAFFTSAQRFAEVMNSLAQIPISAIDAKAFFAGFLVNGSDGADDEKGEGEQVEISTRRANQIDRLVSLFVSGKGNSGANLADVFSAVTDYYSHESSGMKTDTAAREKQIASSEFGNGQAMKALAWRILQDDKRIAKTIADGAQILATADAAEKAKA